MVSTYSDLTCSAVSRLCAIRNSLKYLIVCGGGGWIGRSKKGKERGGGRKEWIEKSTCMCSTTLSLLPTQHHNIHVDTVKPRKLNLPNKLDHTEHIKWAWVHTSVFTHKMVMIAYPWILNPSKMYGIIVPMDFSCYMYNQCTWMWLCCTTKYDEDALMK